MWNLKDNFRAAEVDAQVVVPQYKNPFAKYSGERDILDDAKRTKLIVDSHGNDVGHVTKKYSLIRNPEVRHAVELIGEREGLNLVGIKSQYTRGRTCLVWQDGTTPIKVDGDNSVVYPWVKLTNSYTGSHPLRLDLVLCRYICQNALIWGKTHEIIVSQKHIGEIDLGGLLTQPIRALADAAAVAQLQMNVLAKTQLPSSHPVWVEIKEKTPERYHKPLGTAIRSNAADLGWTVYGALQAVSEIGSNNMRGWAGANWTEASTALLLDTDEVKASQFASVS